MEKAKADETLWSRVPGSVRQVVAAAPDLLEAARGALDFLLDECLYDCIMPHRSSERGFGPSCVTAPVCSTGVLIKQLKDAIAKATGEGDEA